MNEGVGIESNQGISLLEGKQPDVVRVIAVSKGSTGTTASLCDEGLDSPERNLISTYRNTTSPFSSMRKGRSTLLSLRSISRAAYTLFRPSSLHGSRNGHSQQMGTVALQSDVGHESNMKNHERLEDRFSFQLNRCNRESLPQLRQLRADICPIVICESEEEVESEETKNEPIRVEDYGDPGLQSRWEAYNVQQQRLGANHPDVHLFMQHIERYYHHRRQRDEVLSHSHYHPTSAYFNPNQQHMVMME